MNQTNTKYGTINIMPQGKSEAGEHRIYFNTDDLPDLVLRKNEYRCSGHLFQHKDGKFRFGPEFIKRKRYDSTEEVVRPSEWERQSSVYIARKKPGNFTWHDTDLVTPAAKKDLMAEIEKAVNEWVKNAQTELESAERDRVEQMVARTLREIEDTKKEMTALEAKLKTQLDDLTRLNKAIVWRT